MKHGKEYLLNYGIERMIQKKRVFKTQEIETWMDCGTPKLLIESAKKIMSSKIILEENNSFIKSGNVKITQPVFIGKNVKIKFVKDRPGHDFRYAIDNSLISSDLGWKPSYSFAEGLTKTINWYLENLNWCDKFFEKNSYFKKDMKKKFQERNVDCTRPGGLNHLSVFSQCDTY